MKRWLDGAAAGLCGAAFLALATLPAQAQTPIKGGTLTVGSLAVIPTLDCHQLGLSPAMIDLAPIYSTLLRYDPDNYPNVIGDLANSWTVSADKLTYTFKLHPNVKFHDGSAFTSADIKATYQRLLDPPQGVISLRKGYYTAISSIDTPDPLTVVFRLSKPNPAMMLNFADPYACIYSAANLAKDAKYPETKPMGTGPFKFVEYVTGATMSLVRNDNYFVPGLPYLDAFKTVMLQGPAYLNAVAGGQVEGVFCCLTPANESYIRTNRGDKTVFYNAPMIGTDMITVSNKAPGLQDIRVRQAINLSLDRRTGEAMVGATTNQKGIASLFPPGVKYDFTESELEAQPGFGKDIAANRAKAKELLAASGAKDLKFTILTRNSGPPWVELTVFAIDQLKQIGIAGLSNPVDAAPYYAAMASQNYELAIDAQSYPSSDPMQVLNRYLPDDPANYAGVKDPILQDLYDKQANETDQAKRRDLVLQFSKRVMEQAWYIPLYRSVNVAALASYIKGWHVVTVNTNYDMRSTWLDKH